MTARHVPTKARVKRAKAPRICWVIKVAREEAGFTQKEFAGRLKVAQSMVGRWETTSEPRLDVLVKMERVLGLGRGDLVRVGGYVDEVVSVPTAIADDPVLDARAKRLLLATYRALHARHSGVVANGKKVRA